jgi:four helix bundle protein
MSWGCSTRAVTWQDDFANLLRSLSTMRPPRRFDLEDRLLDFAVSVCRIVSCLSKQKAGSHLASQLARSGTSAGANYAEARAAESRRDFIHKLKLVLKELREALFWLRLCRRLKLTLASHLDEAIEECNELIAILVKSIETARNKQ